MVLGDLSHELPVGEVSVEQTQRAGCQGQVLGEFVEGEAVLVEGVHRQLPVLVLGVAEAQERVLPLDVEVQQVLDVDHDGTAVPVDHDVVQAQFTVDDAVLGAWPYCRGQLAQPVLQLGGGVSDPVIAGGRLGEAAQREGECGLLAGGRPRRAARVDPGHLPEGRRPVPPAGSPGSRRGAA